MSTKTRAKVEAIGIVSYMPLAYKMAMAMALKQKNIDIDEFVSAAYLGLVEAGKSFNPELASLKTHIYRRVWGRLLNCVRQNKDKGLTGKVRENYKSCIEHKKIKDEYLIKDSKIIEQLSCKQLQKFLNRKEYLCLIWHYVGITGKEIGSYFNITGGRVCQIRKKALIKLYIILRNDYTRYR